MNIKEASAKYDLPKSRISAALQAGIIKGEKGKRDWALDEKSIEAAMPEKTYCTVDGLNVTVWKSAKLQVKPVGHEAFINKSSVEQYLELFAKR